MTVDRRAQLAATVFVGKDGWLFHREDFVAEQVAGVHTPSPERVEQWRGLLEMRGEWLDARGVQYVLLVVPEKHVIYPDKIIEGFQISDNRPLKLIERSLATHGSRVKLVYPEEALRAERANRDTYFATDTHWNLLGAHLGYCELCRVVGETHPLRVLGEDGIAFDMREFDGDLALRLDPEPESRGLFGVIKNPKGRGVGANGVFSRGSVMVFEQPDRTLPRAVIFRDSFANLLLPLMAESFSRIVAVSSMEMYPELIESEKPDVVITELAERLLHQPIPGSTDSYLPDDSAAVPFDTLCRVTVEDVARYRG